MGETVRDFEPAARKHCFPEAHADERQRASLRAFEPPPRLGLGQLRPTS